MKRTLFVVAWAAAVVAPAPAFAQQAFSFKEEKLIAKIQKPEIQILITKQNLNPKYDLELRESFLPKIVESIDSKPF